MILFVLWVVSLVAWLIILSVLVVRTRNPPVAADEPTAELGPESPAVVDLITGGWRLCDEAAAATALDLAARGVMEIEQVGPELSLVRLACEHPVGLKPYEQMVYDHLSGLAGADGVVAAAALAEGNRHFRRWWRRFRHGVVQEARRLGLSRARFSAAHQGVIAFGMLISSALLAFYLEGGFGLVAAVGLAGAMMGLLKLVSAERGTARGAEAAGRWLGVRAHLRDGRFDEQPPAAVTIYGRRLAYAAVLGLAHQAVTGLPIGREADDRRAWSDYGGLWHPVHVHYPGVPWGIRRRPWLWGRRPGPTLAVSIPVALALALPFLIAGWLWAVLAFLAFVAVPLARCIVDLTGTAVVEGQVVRLRHHGHTLLRTETHSYWIAVDDGKSGRATAYLLPYDLYYRQLNEGDVVRMTVGRGLGWIYNVSILSRAARPQADDGHVGDDDLPESLADMA